jgi:uncharacterized membrane protein (DUF485 family)
MKALAILIVTTFYVGLICLVAYKGASMVRDLNDSMIKQGEVFDLYENS